MSDQHYECSSAILTTLEGLNAVCILGCARGFLQLKIDFSIVFCKQTLAHARNCSYPTTWSDVIKCSRRPLAFLQTVHGHVTHGCQVTASRPMFFIVGLVVHTIRPRTSRHGNILSKNNNISQKNVASFNTTETVAWKASIHQIIVRASIITGTSS